MEITSYKHLELSVELKNVRLYYHVTLVRRSHVMNSAKKDCKKWYVSSNMDRIDTLHYYFSVFLMSKWVFSFNNKSYHSQYS